VSEYEPYETPWGWRRKKNPLTTTSVQKTAVKVAVIHRMGNNGWKPQEIADLLDITEATVIRWWHNDHPYDEDWSQGMRYLYRKYMEKIEEKL